jgi:hypothetical protein
MRYSANASRSVSPARRREFFAAQENALAEARKKKRDEIDKKTKGDKK